MSPRSTSSYEWPNVIVEVAPTINLRIRSHSTEGSELGHAPTGAYLPRLVLRFCFEFGSPALLTHQAGLVDLGIVLIHQYADFEFFSPKAELRGVERDAVVPELTQPRKASL